MSTGSSDTAMRQESDRVVGSTHKQDQTSQMKVALVHDWFVGWGAEAVVYQLHKMYPDAPIYTSYCNKEWRKRLDGKVVTSYLQNWPFSKLRKFIPFLRGLWFSRLDLSEFDLVISSSGAEAKFIKVGHGQPLINSLPAGQAGTQSTVHSPTKPANYQLPTTNYRNMNGPVHIAYIHAPTHYYWSRYNDYLKHPGFGIFDPLARIGLKILVGPMRRWDYRSAGRPDVLIANSSYTQQQIKKYYNRDSTVVHPPVDVDYFSTPSTNYNLQPTKGRSGFVIAGRHTPYKRFDLAITACTRLNLPLTVIGEGPETKKLKAMAGPTIKFLGRIPRDQLRAELQKAEGFIFPGIDDFGIAAVEALAAGTPVVAYKAGGALDYIKEGTNGAFFSNQTSESLERVLKNFHSLKISNKKTSESANKFAVDNFCNNIRSNISGDL